MRGVVMQLVVGILSLEVVDVLLPQMLLLLCLLKLLLLETVLIGCFVGFALLHEDLIDSFDVYVIAVAVVVLSFIEVGGQV